MSLKTRVDSLERNHRQTQSIVVISEYVVAGGAAQLVKGYRLPAGERILRRPGESVDALSRRAGKLAMTNCAGSCAHLEPIL